MIKLFNTLGRQLQDFEPVHKPEVKLYTCGPTVYDETQLGNLRTFVFYDTLRRVLEAEGYRVNHVMNITDVGHLTSDADEGEDKLEKGAKREGKTVWQIADHYIGLFKEDVEALNILPPEYARATDFIDAQIGIVAKLLEKGYAYQTEQAIYFDVSKMSDYGQLTGQRLDEKEVAARAEVHTDDNKRHPQDFALWFFTVGRYEGHEMRWDSPWGQGFPGWHLECSAIAHQLLREPLDIHAGGVDLIGTHHTNEIAQTEAAFGKKLARFWVHGEHLLVEGGKMSKSAGNYLTLKDVAERGSEPLALRLLFLQSHYRNQMNFTWQSLEAAQTFLSNLRAWADLVHQPQSGESASIEGIAAAMADDLNTPRALAQLSEMINGGKVPDQKTLGELDLLLGLDFAKRPDIREDQKELIKQREAARANQQWEQADRLRSELAKSGIEIEDTADGPVWRRI